MFIAAHKPYTFPDDGVYQPIQVGKALADTDLGFPGDDTGENISALNPTYNELTAVYWAWKNAQTDAYGLNHYRRYFVGASGPATGAELYSWLEGAEVVVAKKRHYVVETVAGQYSHAHHASDLEAVRQALADVAPADLGAFDQVMAGRSLSLYNMFWMRAELFGEYAEWLFGILQAAEPSIPWRSYGPQQRRVMGYLGERLLNVWLQANPALRVRRQRVFQTEAEPLVRKGVKMLGRKLGFGKVR
ncbi:MAG: DUF4422 domain-containing protein [Propionibacteriaceae bacterium]|jgi:hypothetical protein|nr:DUF4422 domain-containing protein [Propionibacteriaceae bacterium]